MDLHDKAIAVLVAPGAPDSEVDPVVEALRREGVPFRIIGPDRASLDALPLESGRLLRADALVGGAQETWFDALIIVGGPHVDRFSEDEGALDLVTQFEIDAKPIATVGHGLDLLLAAELVAGMRVAAPTSLRDRIESAGGYPVAEPVTEFETWITATGPQGIPELMRRLFDAMRRIHLSAHASQSPILD